MTIPSRSSDILPWLLFLLSLLLRLALISKGPYHVDCLQLAIHAEKTLLTFELHPLFGPGYPLTVVLGAIFVFCGRWVGIHDPVMSVNVMSAVFSSLCISANYSLVRRLFNQRAAFTSSLMLSFFPIFLVISVYGKSHTPSLFFLLAGLSSLSAYLQEKNTRSLLLSAGLLGLMGAARLQDLVLMAIPISAFFWLNAFDQTKQNRARHPLIHFLLFGIITAAVAGLFHLPMILQTGTQAYSSQFGRFWQMGLLKNFIGFLSPSLLFSLKNILFGLTPVGAMISLMGITLMLKTQRKTLLFLLLWMTVPLAFYGNLGTTAPRFLVLPALPLIIAQGVCWAHLTQYKNKAFNLGIITAYAIIIFIIFINIYPILQFRHNHALLPDFGRYVAQKTEPRAWIISGDEGLFIEHYGRRKLLRRPKSGGDYHNNEMKALESEIDSLLNRGDPVYITGSGLYSYDPSLRISTMLKEHYTLITIGRRLTEDWHRGGTRLRTGWEYLYQITPRSADQ